LANEIAACAGDSKKLWNVFNTVLGEKCSVNTDLHTADEFAAFFQDKVESMRAFTESTPLYDVPFRTSTLEHFTHMAGEGNACVAFTICFVVSAISQ